MGKLKSNSDNRNRTTNAIITVSVSIAALVVSVAQVLTMQSELKTNSQLQTLEINNSKLHSERLWAMDASKLTQVQRWQY